MKLKICRGDISDRFALDNRLYGLTVKDFLSSRAESAK